jgi:hypothetical protein
MFAYLCQLTARGSSRAQSSWTEWKGRCVSCTKPIANGEGVFCASFLFRREGWTSCLKVWCGECYNVPSTSPFLVKKVADDKGFDQTLGGDEKRFKVGRNGDNLMCPFQCDLCHFRNIQKRDFRPADVKDRLLLQCICRASLDAFWAREPSTV